MAMKFWFGKKETEQEDRAAVPCGVVAMSGSTADVLVQAPVPAVAPAQLFVAAPAAVHTPAFVAEAPQGIVDAVQAVGSVASATCAAGEKGGVADGAAEAPKPVALKAVTGGATSSLRLAAAAPAPAAAQLKPIGAVAALRPVSAAGAGRAPAFGLRPKGEVATEPLPPLAEEKTSAVVERDGDLVRPKTDQRALYYELMNGLYDAVLILDKQGHVVDCNTRLTDMLGYPREDTWDMPIEKIITGMSRQMFEHLKRNLAESHHILIDARCFRKDGTSFAGEVGVSTFTLTRGANIVFTVRNVERRKHAMDDLRKSHAALEVALAPAFVCDTDGFFLVTNHALLEVFGIPDEEQAKSVRFVDVLPDAARFFVRASCGEKVREKLRVAAPNGQPVKLELSFAPVQSGQNITGVAGSILQI